MRTKQILRILREPIIDQLLVVPSYITPILIFIQQPKCTKQYVIKSGT